jgi:hypothetical protein
MFSLEGWKLLSGPGSPHEGLKETLVLALKFFLFVGPHKPGSVLGSGFTGKPGSRSAALAIELIV